MAAPNMQAGAQRSQPSSPPEEIFPAVRAEAVRADPIREADEYARMIRGRGPLIPEPGQFYIDPKLAPPGWSYEMKRIRTYGQPDEENMIALEQGGWRAVPQARHPHVLVEFGGMRLMERPTSLCDEVNAVFQQAAIAPVQGLGEALGIAPPGTAPRLKPSIQRGAYEENGESDIPD